MLVGDIEFEEGDGLIPMLLLAARSRINALCTAPQRFVQESPADATIGAGNQHRFVFDVQDMLL